MQRLGRKFFIPLIILALYFGGRAWYFSPNAAADERAPDFTAIQADGRSVHLQELQGAPVLLDFWGSWCGPCRRETPELHQLFQDHGDELTILSVAIERDSAAWQRALASRTPRIRKKMEWRHVMEVSSSLKFLNGPIADLYGINSVPSNILIGADGVVLGVNLPLREIPEYLK